MKKILLFIFAIPVLLSACATERNSIENTFEATDDNPKYPEAFSASLDKIQRLTLPYSMDTNLLKNFEASGLEVPEAELRLLLSNFVNIHADYDNLYAYEALRINRLKLMSEYETYVENLDIGQLKNATANYLGKLETGNKAIILWTVSISSYEACPFYSGTQVFASVIEKGIISESLQVGQYFAGGDPPSMFEHVSNFKIDKNLRLEKKSEYKVWDEDVLVEDTKENVSRELPRFH